jgi:transcriptional regulator with XRE-family HTH domain
MTKQKLKLNRLGEILQERGIKNQFIADKLQLTKASVSNYVTNSHQPSLETLYQIATLLDIDVTLLLCPEVKIRPKAEPRKQKKRKPRNDIQ